VRCICKNGQGKRYVRVAELACWSGVFCCGQAKHGVINKRSTYLTLIWLHSVNARLLSKHRSASLLLTERVEESETCSRPLFMSLQRFGHSANASVSIYPADFKEISPFVAFGSFAVARYPRLSRECLIQRLCIVHRTQALP